MTASLTLLRARGRVRRPWKNGGGTTTEIAAHPERSTLDNFGWRISMADVAESGPFSIFPGVERTLAVLNGNGLYLRLGQGESPRRIATDGDPISFAGDIPAHAELIGGAVQDLNVMTRRGAWRHSLMRVAGPSSTLDFTAPVSLLLCLDGSAQIEAATRTIALSSRDALRVDGAIGTVAVKSTSSVYFIELWPQQEGGDRQTLSTRAYTIN